MTRVHLAVQRLYAIKMAPETVTQYDYMAAITKSRSNTSSMSSLAYPATLPVFYGPDAGVVQW